MTLVDTSVWIDYFRSGVPLLDRLLGAQTVLGHPYVFGELLCGNLGRATPALALLEGLHPVPMATDDEVVALIRARRLTGRGIGYLDAHLVASALISESTTLWTTDLRLAAVASELGVLFEA